MIFLVNKYTRVQKGLRRLYTEVISTYNKQ